MTDALARIGITAGEKTELRDITAPQIGEDYLDSYYEMLSSIETDTIHVYEDTASLPEPQYDSLVAIAPSQAEDIDADALYVYDGTEWHDTASPVHDLKDENERLKQRITELEDTDFQVVDSDFPDEVQTNQHNDYKATIKNEGEIDGSQKIEFISYTDGVIDSHEWDIEAGEKKDIKVTHAFPDKDMKSIRIQTDDDSTLFHSVTIDE